jgi:hypothetical protein
MLNLQNAESFLGAQVATASKASWTKFTQAGEWFVGPDMDCLSPTDRWVAKLETCKIGYIGWEAGRLVGAHMVPLTDPMPNINSLKVINGSNGDGWSKSMSFEVIGTGDWSGVELLISLSSQGGVKAIYEFLQAAAVSPELKAGKMPVITLSGSSYYNKRFEKDIFYPVFTIEDWVHVPA